MADNEQWVIWNGSLGILDMVSIGRVEAGEAGRLGFLDPPYGIVGPFSLDELEAEGRIAFGACLVMSRARWRQDQVELRAEALRTRRAFMSAPAPGDGGRVHREALDLPVEGVLEVTQINAAFRRLAKSAHPDAGGSDAHYRRIAEARDALLALFAAAS
ncbi:J domain-containing protein [Xanthobacter sediminis]|uniref:J domain-containing protein n=1 Tax=Xanthobacter sediminis TaxID=3119926 RepID=UPI0037281255